MDRIPVLGVGFDNLTCEEALARCLEIAEHAKGYVVTPNPEIVYRCRKDPVANRVVNGGSLVIPDGIGVIYGAKILGTPIKARIPGIDLACALMQQMNQSGLKLFLLGAKPGIAQKAADNLRITYPNLQIVGTHDGYFQDDTPVIQAINAVKTGRAFCLPRFAAPRTMDKRSFGGTGRPFVYVSGWFSGCFFRHRGTRSLVLQEMWAGMAVSPLSATKPIRSYGCFA